MSTGGLVALSLATQRPDVVDRIVLLGTVAPDGGVGELDETYAPAWLDEVTDEAARARQHARARPRPSSQGPTLDETLRFEPAEIQAKTLLLYGYADTYVSPAHAKWWKDRLPNSRIEMMPGIGHVMVVPGWKRTLSHLAPRRKG